MTKQKTIEKGKKLVNISAISSWFTVRKLNKVELASRTRDMVFSSIEKRTAAKKGKKASKNRLLDTCVCFFEVKTNVKTINTPSPTNTLTKAPRNEK